MRDYIRRSRTGKVGTDKIKSSFRGKSEEYQSKVVLNRCFFMCLGSHLIFQLLFLKVGPDTFRLRRACLGSWSCMEPEAVPQEHSRHLGARSRRGILRIYALAGWLYNSVIMESISG